MESQREESEAILAVSKILDAEWAHYLDHGTFTPSTKNLAVKFPQMAYWVGPFLQLSSETYKAQYQNNNSLAVYLDPNQSVLSVRFISEYPKSKFVAGYLTLQGNQKIRRGILRPDDIFTGHLG